MSCTNGRSIRVPAISSIALVRAGLLVFAVAASGNALGLWDAHAGVVGLPDFCLIHRLSGYECPGCGMGRALALLAGAEFYGSLRQHPFALPFLAFLAAWAVLPKRAVGEISRRSPSARHLLPGVASASLILWWLATRVV